jgi:hypothetical protein
MSSASSLVASNLEVYMRSLFAIALVVGVLSPETSESASYTFTSLADSSSYFEEFGVPTINSAGTVAFSAVLDDGTSAVYSISGATIASVADSTGQFSNFSPFVAINDAGTVAFRAELDTGMRGIYTGSGGATTTIADDSGQLNFPNAALLLGKLAINANGTVSFLAGRDAGGQGIFSGSGGAITTIATSGPAQPFSSLGLGPAIRTDGTVVFQAVHVGGGPGIFTGSGGAAFTIVDSAGIFNDFGMFPFASADTIGFLASLDGGGQGIFMTGGAGTTIMIADSTGPFSTFVEPSTSSNSSVAFVATLDTGSSHGIYTGDDPVADKVIQEQELLFGLTIDSVQFLHGSNANGQIVFRYMAFGGAEIISGIAMATPMLVPEPSSLAGIILAIAMCCSGRRRATGFQFRIFRIHCGTFSLQDAANGDPPASGLHAFANCFSTTL